MRKDVVNARLSTTLDFCDLATTDAPDQWSLASMPEAFKIGPYGTVRGRIESTEPRGDL